MAGTVTAKKPALPGLGALRHRLGAMSFRRRLVLLAAAAVAAAILLASGVVYVVVRQELRSEVDDQLRSLTENITPPSYLPPGPGQPATDVFFLPTAPLGGREGYAQIVQPDGTVIRPIGKNINLPVQRRTLAVAAGRGKAFFHDATVDGVHARVYTARLPSVGAVQAVRPLDDLDRTLRRLAIVLVLVSLGGIALAVWLGWVVSRAALRPVAHLTDAAEHVARTRDLSRRIGTEGRDDELGRLGNSFNTMLEALDASQKAQRQLVADASHELRTPLTSLRTNIEVLATENSLPAEDRRRLVEDVVGQLEELTLLISDLMDLARGDEPEEAMEEVRLDQLVAHTVERAGRIAPDRRFETRLEPCVVRAVPARVERAAMNLLDNAVKWSPPEGVIEVVVDDCELSVRDFGPGIAESDIPFVFDRFYRAPASRGLPGSGLGLAIVRQVAESHGGSVEVESPRGGGARLRLRLRRASDTVPAELWSTRQ
jgi:two-component system sensor histidine kinase MprB